MIYHDGQCLVVYNPSINIPWEEGPHPAPNNVVLHQGPNGREWTIISPESLTDLGHCVNIFDAPEGGYNQQPPNQISKVKVFWPTGRLEDTLFAPHPRLEVISLRNPAPAALRVGGVTATGEHVGHRLVSALNIETAYEAGGLPFISDIVADEDAFGGWAVQLVGNTDNPPAFLVPLWVGTDIRNGHTVTLKVRYRVLTPTAGGFRHIIQANAVTLETATIPSSMRYATHTVKHAVNGRSVGDVLTFGVYNPSDQTAHVSSLLVEVS
jgi:hypothetical protein